MKLVTQLTVYAIQRSFVTHVTYQRGPLRNLVNVRCLVIHYLRLYLKTITVFFRVNWTYFITIAQSSTYTAYGSVPYYPVRSRSSLGASSRSRIHETQFSHQVEVFSEASVAAQDSRTFESVRPTTSMGVGSDKARSFDLNRPKPYFPISRIGLTK